MVENKLILSALNERRYTVYNRALLFGGIVLGTYLYRRERHLRHHADLAKEFCMSQVVNFKACKPNWINPCKNELYDLHDCIYRSKGYNQTDRDLF